ncbi:ABC transporter substrate-binding protein [Treponema sp.]|uniref:ABC transporter substrate-binding protein n=1 Tax=Treponema sp. TaxID=166 RepID=UPI003F0D5D78
MKKTNLIADIALVLLMLTEFSGCSKEEFVFKIGTSNSGLCAAPLHIAIDNGYFDEEFSKAGIKWEPVEIEMAKASELAVAGKIDATLGLAGSLIPQMDNGLDVKFLTGIHTGCTKFYVREDSPYYTVADLKGQTVGFCAVQDSSTIAFQRKFHDYGLTAFGPNQEFKIAVYGMTDLPLALENKAVEAIGLHDPVAYITERDYKVRKILDTTEDEKFSQEYCCMTFVSSVIAEKYPEATAAFVRAILKASAYVKANPLRSAELQIENKQMSGDVNQNAYLLSTYNYTPSVNLAKKTMHDAIYQLVEMGVLQNIEDKDEFIENHFISFEGVPDSYIYNDDGTFSETYVEKLGRHEADKNLNNLVSAEIKHKNSCFD